MSSNIRDAVAEAIWAAIDDDPDDPTPWEDCPEGWKQVTREQADAAIAAHLEALDEANTIRTVAELDALPLGSVIRCGDDILIRSDQFHGGLCWRYNPDGEPIFLIDDDLPARVLCRPEGA